MFFQLFNDSQSMNQIFFSLILTKLIEILNWCEGATNTFFVCLPTTTTCHQNVPLPQGPPWSINTYLSALMKRTNKGKVVTFFVKVICLYSLQELSKLIFKQNTVLATNEELKGSKLFSCTSKLYLKSLNYKRLHSCYTSWSMGP